MCNHFPFYILKRLTDEDAESTPRPVWTLITVPTHRHGPWHVRLSHPDTPCASVLPQVRWTCPWRRAPWLRMRSRSRWPGSRGSGRCLSEGSRSSALCEKHKSLAACWLFRSARVRLGCVEVYLQHALINLTEDLIKLTRYLSFPSSVAHCMMDTLLVLHSRHRLSLKLDVHILVSMLF